MLPFISTLERLSGSGGVLAYHGVGTDPHLPMMHVTPEAFRTQMAFVSSNYRIIPLREYLARVRSGRSNRRVVAVTFDDAYVGVARYAAPILRDFDLPATVFVTAGPAVEGDCYWWDVAEIVRGSGHEDQWSQLLNQIGLPAMPAESAATELIRARVLARFGGLWPEALRASQDPPATSEWRSLTYTELRAFAADERFDFGCHTVRHPVLPALPAAEQGREISAGYLRLQEELPRVRPILAYPYGLYDAETIGAAQLTGMEAAVTMEGRAPARRHNPFTVPRVGLGVVHNCRSIRLRLINALRPALILRNGGRHPRIPTDPVVPFCSES